MGDRHHFAAEIAQGAGLPPGRHAAGRHHGAQGHELAPVMPAHQGGGGIKGGIVVQQADPEGGLRHHHRRAAGVRPAHFEEPLQPHIGEGGCHVVGEVPDACLARRGIAEISVEEITEGAAGDVDVAVAIDEIHRHLVDQPVHVALEAEAFLEEHRGDAGTGVVGVGPDMSTVRHPSVRLALVERRIGEQGGGQRLQRQRHTQLLHHVGFAAVVEIDLHGTGPRHHVEAHRADQGHVAFHDGVAPLGHPRHLLALLHRVEAERGEAEIERLRDGADIGVVGLDFGQRVMQRRHQAAGQFELAGRFQRHRGGAAGQPDRVAAIENRLPPGCRDAFEDRADAGGFIRRRTEIRLGEAELLVLGANGEAGGRLAADGDEVGELTHRRYRRRIGFPGIGHR